ncbi:MAG: hypothetical protein H7A34_02135 [bacterium]|nr:hypothetical protein [bacterium]
MAKQKLLVSTAIFLLSAIVFGQFGFKGELTRDEAIYMYSGQQFAHGVAPYASIFDHKGPMASIITGFGVVVANWCGFDDLTTVRVLFYFICCLTAVALYFFSIQLFGSSRLGWFAVSVLYTYWEFGRKAMSGPRKSSHGTFSNYFVAFNSKEKMVLGRFMVQYYCIGMAADRCAWGFCGSTCVLSG